MSKIKFLIWFFIFPYSLFSQVLEDSILLKPVSFNLDYEIKHHDDYKKTYIVIYDNIDTITKKVTNNLFNDIHSLKYLIDKDSFEITCLYFYHHPDSNMCSSANLLLHFVINGVQLPSLPLSTVPAAFIYTNNNAKKAILDGTRSFKKFPDNKNYYTCTKRKDIIEFILSDYHKSNLGNIINDSLENLRIKYHLDSRDMPKPDDLTNHFLSFSWSPQFSIGPWFDSISKKSFHGIGAISFNYTYHKKDNHLGFGLDIGYNYWGLDLSKENFIDTIPKSVDFTGDSYTRKIYAKNIEEHADVKTISVTPQLSIRIKLNDDWLINICPGIKFTTVLSSTFQATNGTLSYRGYYPQYNTKVDTMFNNLYDYYSDVPVNKTEQHLNEQHLKLKNEIISLFLPINFNYFFGKYLGVNAGLYYEVGLSSILNNDMKDKVVSTGLNSYNSLLYREETIRINSLGFKIGLSYKF